jgi:hypothetical protein
MDHKKMSGKVYLGLICCIVFFLGGCAEFKDVHHAMLKGMRSPGEIMEKNPEETSQAFFEFCKNRKPNMAFLEAEVIPHRTVEGREVNHRIRYAICHSPENPYGGEIIRKVYHKGAAVFQDRTRYEFKQGTWVVDAFIKVPFDASLGTYEVDTIISYRNNSSRIRNTFEVIKRDRN